MVIIKMNEKSLQINWLQFVKSFLLTFVLFAKIVTAFAMIHDGIYYSTISNQPKNGYYSYKVITANPPFNTRYIKMKKTITNEFSATSSFSELNPSYFRVMVGVRDPAPFALYKQNTENQVIQSIYSGYHSIPILIYSIDTQFQGHPAFYMVFKHKANNTTYTSGILTALWPKHLVLLWVQVDDNFKSTYRLTQKIINRTWAPEEEFFNSFKLYSNNSPYKDRQ